MQVDRRTSRLPPVQVPVSQAMRSAIRRPPVLLPAARSIAAWRSAASLDEALAARAVTQRVPTGSWAVPQVMSRGANWAGTPGSPARGVLRHDSPASVSPRLESPPPAAGLISASPLLPPAQPPPTAEISSASAMNGVDLGITNQPRY